MKTLTECIEAAKRLTAKVANLKDYQVRNAKNRKAREYARELSAGKGYVIASVAEMVERFPEYFGAGLKLDTHKRVWCWMNTGAGKISLIAYR